MKLSKLLRKIVKYQSEGKLNNSIICDMIKKYCKFCNPDCLPPDTNEYDLMCELNYIYHFVELYKSRFFDYEIEIVNDFLNFYSGQVICIPETWSIYNEISFLNTSNDKSFGIREVNSIIHNLKDGYEYLFEAILNKSYNTYPYVGNLYFTKSILQIMLTEFDSNYEFFIKSSVNESNIYNVIYRCISQFVNSNKTIDNLTKF